MKLATLLSTATLATAICLRAGFVPSSAHAFYCGQHVVERGDPMARVRQYCGDPVTAISRTEVRTTFGMVSGVTYGVPIAVTVQIDTWTFDFGPMRFMEEVTFENGVVYASRPMGYGTPNGTNRGGMQARARSGSLLFAPRRRGALGGL